MLHTGGAPYPVPSVPSLQSATGAGATLPPAAPPSHLLGRIAVGFGGHGNVLPEECGEITLVLPADVEANRAQRHIRLGQELSGACNPALEHIVVGGLPGSALEQRSKVVRAHLDDSCKRGQG